MNAGGVLNTCKSSGNSLQLAANYFSGGRVSNAWVTCLTLGDNIVKTMLIPHKTTRSHDLEVKTPVV